MLSSTSRLVYSRDNFSIFSNEFQLMYQLRINEINIFRKSFLQETRRWERMSKFFGASSESESGKSSTTHVFLTITLKLIDSPLAASSDVDWRCNLSCTHLLLNAVSKHLFISLILPWRLNILSYPFDSLSLLLLYVCASHEIVVSVNTRCLSMLVLIIFYI